MAKTRRVWGGYICNDLISTTGECIREAIHELEIIIAGCNQADTLKRLCKVLALLSKAGVAIFTLRDIFRDHQSEQERKE